MERFTQRAKRVLSLAHEEAERLRHKYIGTEFLLLGLIREEGGIAGRVLRDLGLHPAGVKEMVEQLTGVGRHRGNRIEMAPETEQVLEMAIEEARRMGHHLIGTEHLLLGMIRQGKGKGIDVLRRLGITLEQIERQTRRVLEDAHASRKENREQLRLTDWDELMTAIIEDTVSKVSRLLNLQRVEASKAIANVLTDLEDVHKVLSVQSRSGEISEDAITSLENAMSVLQDLHKKLHKPDE